MIGFESGVAAASAADATHPFPDLNILSSLASSQLDGQTGSRPANPKRKAAITNLLNNDSEVVQPHPTSTCVEKLQRIALSLQKFSEGLKPASYEDLHTANKILVALLREAVVSVNSHAATAPADRKEALRSLILVLPSQMPAPDHSTPSQYARDLKHLFSKASVFVQNVLLALARTPSPE